MIVYGVTVTDVNTEETLSHPVVYKNKTRAIALKRLFSYRATKATRAFNVLTNTLSSDLQKHCAMTLYSKYKVYRNKLYKIVTFEVE